jgi:nitroreductase
MSGQAADVDFQTVVRQRRMVRAFSSRPVALERIEHLVRLAQHAPSAGFSQGVSFLLVTERAMRERLAILAGEAWYTSVGHAPFVSQAPVQLVVCTSEARYRERYREADKARWESPDREFPIPWWYVDAGCALMLVLLGAVEEGLAAAFVGVRDPGPLRAELGIPTDVTPIGIVLLGHPAPDKPSGSLRRGRRRLDEVLHRERW